MMVELLQQQVAKVLGTKPEKLELDKPLTELGLDSLMGVELRNWIEGELRLSLATVGPTLPALAAQIALDVVENLQPPGWPAHKRVGGGRVQVVPDERPRNRIL